MTRRPAISYRSRWAIYLYYTVLHYRSHIKGDLVERYNFCCYDGRYSCIKLQSCHAISLVKWVKKLNYSLKKCENMFICLILHTNIIKIIHIVFYDINISGDAVPRNILGTYENIWKIYLHVIYTSCGITQFFSLFIFILCIQHRVFFLLFRSINRSKQFFLFQITHFRVKLVY